MVMRPFLSDCRKGAVFWRLISGGSRSPEQFGPELTAERLAEGNAESRSLQRDADKSLKRLAREARNRRKDFMTILNHGR
jgi:hypothetical protein